MVSLDAAAEARCAAEAERGLTLLGATGVEDKLQADSSSLLGGKLRVADMRDGVLTFERAEDAERCAA